MGGSRAAEQQRGYKAPPSERGERVRMQRHTTHAHVSRMALKATWNHALLGA
jgi:hypothetical protein